MSDDEFTCDIFRFLQLLCEGHNNGELPEMKTNASEYFHHFCLLAVVFEEKIVKIIKRCSKNISVQI